LIAMAVAARRGRCNEPTLAPAGPTEAVVTGAHSLAYFAEGLGQCGLGQENSRIRVAVHLENAALLLRQCTCGARPPDWWRLACSSAGVRLAGLANDLEPAPASQSCVSKFRKTFPVLERHNSGCGGTAASPDGAFPCPSAGRDVHRDRHPSRKSIAHRFPPSYASPMFTVPAALAPQGETS
jgi:hypothetical protein